MNVQCNQPIFCYNCESIHKGNLCDFDEWYFPNNERYLGMCDELSFGCSSHKDQALIMWMILTQKYVSFYNCVMCSVWMVHALCVGL
jgi:hypothetical protein